MKSTLPHSSPILHTFFQKFDPFADAPNVVAKMRELVLDLAVQGILVESRASDGDGHTLLKKLRMLPPERNSKSRSPKDTPVEPDTPLEIPSHWALTTVENTTRETGFFCDGDWVESKDQDPDGDVSSLKHGYAFSSNFFTSEPAPFVLTTPGNFYEKGGFRDRESKRKYYSGPVDPEFVFKPGDLIIPMTEQAAGLLGSPAFIPDGGRVYIHNQRLGKLSFSESIAPEFAFWFFNSEFFRGELARTCTGMKVRHTSPDRVLKVPFPLPPLAEQLRIVAKVDQLMALVEQLETQLAASRTTAANLLEALVAELTAASANGAFQTSLGQRPSRNRKQNEG